MNELLVLCYHSLSEDWQAETSVRPADFESHMEDLVRRGYRGATFSDALTAPRPGRTLVVTFDDAHASVLEYAVPVMERLGLPGTVFVVTDYPGAMRLLAWDGYDVWLGTEYHDELRCMSWDDLRGLADRGWEIGSHTCTHSPLSGLDDERLADELQRSRATCESEIGVPCRSLAYPYGVYDDRVVRATRDGGYLFAATVDRGPTAPLPLRWPRIPMRHGQSARLVRRRARRRRLGPSPMARLARIARR